MRSWKRRTRARHDRELRVHNVPAFAVVNSQHPRWKKRRRRIIKQMIAQHRAATARFFHRLEEERLHRENSIL